MKIEELKTAVVNAEMRNCLSVKVLADVPGRHPSTSNSSTLSQVAWKDRFATATPSHSPKRTRRNTPKEDNEAL